LPDWLPPSVRHLIATRVESLETMRVLFLLRDHPDRTWTAREVAASLALDDVAVSRELIWLRQRGLLAVEMSDDASYRYAPSGELDAVVDELRARSRA
jgi:hypothetical protein